MSPEVGGALLLVSGPVPALRVPPPPPPSSKRQLCPHSVITEGAPASHPRGPMAPPWPVALVRLQKPGRISPKPCAQCMLQSESPCSPPTGMHGGLMPSLPLPLPRVWPDGLPPNSLLRMGAQDGGTRVPHTLAAKAKRQPGQRRSHGETPPQWREDHIADVC